MLLDVFCMQLRATVSCVWYLLFTCVVAPDVHAVIPFQQFLGSQSMIVGCHDNWLACIVVHVLLYGKQSIVYCMCYPHSLEVKL